MKKHIFILIALAILLLTGVGYAQEASTGKVAYITFLVGSVDVDTTPDNQKEDFKLAELDMELPQGTIVRTGKNALCEITLYDGSTIKISSGSVFQIESVSYEAETGKKTGKFKLVFGKVRAKVEKLTTTDSKFEISSGTSLAGIRGTSFGVFFDGAKSQVLVFTDSVYLESLIGAFEPLVIDAGKFTTVLPDGIAEPVADIPPEMLKEWEQELEKFTKKVVEEVKPAPEKKEEIAAKPEKKPEKEGWLEKFLKLNAYVGTITIDKNVYARWIFTPQITIGKLGVGLYLPAIFSPDVGIFGFKDWENHDEWDFTSFLDGLHDALIKFYYISWGQLGDPLYFKIGSIDNFFLGHGFIVDNYSNMLYFPEVLTIGMQLNIDAEHGGIETMVADFSNFQLFGARAYVRPMGKSVPLAFGLTGVHDRPKPDSEAWPASTTKEEQLPRIIILGADAELPIIKLDLFSIKLYADAAKLGYIYPELEPALPSDVKEGFIQFVKGLGTGVGVMGNITKMFTYRFEYRFILDYYEPGLINPLWANRRLIYPQELLALIKAQKDPDYENTTSAGWLLRGGMTLFKKLEFGLGYENYTTTTGTGEEKVNKGSAYVNLDKGLVPKVYGDFSYNRNANLENIFKEPFDENTLLQTNIFYELAPGIAMAVNYKRTFKYNEVTGEYDPIDSFGINTVFSF